MASREQCVAAINNFIKTQDLKAAVTLFEYLCDVKEVTNKKEAMEAVCRNPILLSELLPATIDALERHFDINSVSDKNNNLITVYKQLWY